MRTSLRFLAFLILCLAGLEDPARSVAVAAPKCAEVVAEYGYRYYAAELGRWLNQDPLGETGGTNLCGFVGNNGVNGVDVLGLTLRDWFVESIVNSRETGHPIVAGALVGAFGIWNGVTMGALDRREQLEQALEAGKITQGQYQNGQLMNGAVSLVNVALTYGGGELAGGFAGAGKAALSRILRGSLGGSALVMLQEGGLVSADELSRWQGGLDQQNTWCEILQRLQRAGKLGAVFGAGGASLGELAGKLAGLYRANRGDPTKVVKALQEAMGGEQATKGGRWVLPEGGGGATINGRWFTEHTLERIAPRTPEVMATLESRAMQRAQAAGLKPQTPEFQQWWRKHGPDPRGVPPSVIEAEIANPGTTGVRVITNANGDVVTVIPGG